MKIAAPKEIFKGENRVALTPSSALELIKLGHECIVQSGAGISSRYDDNAYKAAGVKIVKSAVALWKEAGGQPARLHVSSTIPIGKGMSSSAALCLSVVLCVHGKSIDKQDACIEAQRLEHVVLGTPCGLLDQMTMMHSLENHCVLIDFSTMETSVIPLPSDWRFKLVDSGIHRTLNSQHYRNTSNGRCWSNYL